MSNIIRITPRPMGAHMSTSGSLNTAVEQSVVVGATAVQIFTKSQLRWHAPPISAAAAKSFREAVAAAGLVWVSVHDSYLINLAATTEESRQKSIASLIHEVERADMLGCHCVVLHPGSPKEDGLEVGIERVAAGLKAVLAATAGSTVTVALENTAGQGATLGVRLAELRAMIDGCGGDPRLAVCLDTCHAFAAGYELRTPQAVTAFADEVERELGLARVAMFHVNDSKKDCGSRVDRHEHIGQGCIGAEGFRHFFAEPRFHGIPSILETPKEDDPTLPEDRMNLAKLRELGA